MQRTPPRSCNLCWCLLTCQVTTSHFGFKRLKLNSLAHPPGGVRKWAKICKNGPKCVKTGQKSGKCAKMSQNCAKIGQNSSKMWQKFVKQILVKNLLFNSKLKKSKPWNGIWDKLDRETKMCAACAYHQGKTTPFGRLTEGLLNGVFPFLLGNLLFGGPFLNHPRLWFALKRNCRGGKGN